MQTSKLGTTVKLEVECEPNFILATWKSKRIYICLEALSKDSWHVKGIFLGIDGCFVNGRYPFQVL